MDKEPIKLSLVVPCYNEAKSLPLLVGRIKECFNRADVEIVLVDNGSSDDTPKLLPELIRTETNKSTVNIRTVRVDVNQGYGFGILAGLAEAKGQYIGWTHADLQTDPKDALEALKIIERETSGVFIKGKRYGRPLFDRLFSFGMGVFETVYMRVPLWEINAQPTIFPRSFYQSWVNPPHDFSLDLYAFYTARKANLKVFRIPVYFAQRKYGSSHWNVDFSSKIKFIKRTLKFSVELKRELFGAK
jgi:glycosyltransferase involved in cell wall biosynthesis